MSSVLDRLFAPRFSVRLFGIAAVVLGLVGLVWGDSAVVWQPVPGGVPTRTAPAYAVAAAALLAGTAIQWRRTAARGAIALTALYALAVVLLDFPRVLVRPAVFANWYEIAEPLALAAGGAVAYASCGPLDRRAAARLAYIGRLLFGGCVVVFGLAHLVFPAYTAMLVPPWLPPSQITWVYVTAAAHLAAGLAILTGMFARAAAVALTAMFMVFGIVIHAPTLVLEPHTHSYWAENAINLALIGAAWVVAASLRSPQAARRG